MAHPINEKLKMIADSSALKQSVVPVFLCDENFNVCTKSIGATELFKRPAVRSSVLGQLESEVTEKLSKSPDGGAMLAALKRDNGIVYVILTVGTVDNERYYAMIIEPRISFCPATEPWYMVTAFDAICSSVNELITSPPGNYPKLKLDCTRLARLCTFLDNDPFFVHSMHPKKCYVNHLLNLVAKEASAPFKLIGGFIDVEIKGKYNYVSLRSPKELFTLISTLLFASLLISKRNHATLGCKVAEDQSKTLELSVTVSEPNMGGKEINTYSDLIKAAVPISIELAALAEMARKAQIELECHSCDNSLKVSCLIPGEVTTQMVVKKPQKDPDRTYLQNLLKELFALAGEHFKNK